MKLSEKNNADYLRAKKELEQAVMYCPGEKARREPTELALQVLANLIKKARKRPVPTD